MLIKGNVPEYLNDLDGIMILIGRTKIKVSDTTGEALFTCQSEKGLQLREVLHEVRSGYAETAISK